MKLLVTGAMKKDEAFFNEIASLGYEIVFVQDERIPLVEQGMDASCFDCVICNSLFQYNDIIDFKSLRFILLTSAGCERVPIDYIKSKGIVLQNARGVYSIPMAEYALCGVLQLYKQSEFFAENRRKHLWQKHRNLKELYGKTVCIVGCGSVGAECAKLFTAFGCTVIGVDVCDVGKISFSQSFSCEKIDRALSLSDVVVLSLPVNEKTWHLMNRERFSAMKDNAVLVNIARGEIVDTQALIDNLKDKLFGAVIDVFENEPLPSYSELWSMKNVILTPHNSFVGENNDARLKSSIKSFLEQI